MKKILFITAIIILMSASTNAQARVTGSFGVFYSSLAPYGEWIELEPDFYAWRPIYVRHGWRPYTNGRWAWTSSGWYWVSYEPFGWATFHYGRWYYDDYYGWIWIPGHEWAPAWVEWRYNDDYIGWAPLPPYATFRISVGIHFTTRWHAPVHYWSFVRYRYFCSPRVVDYYVSVESSRRFFGNTRYRTDYEYDNNRIINRGIDKEFVERRSGERIRTAEIIETRDRQTERIVREGDRPRIEVYRPTDSDVERLRPERIEARRPDKKISLDMDKIEREIYRDEQRQDEKKIEQRKHSERYKLEEQKPEIRKDSQERQPEYREERKSREQERKPEYKPERREREIEIRKEHVKPREYRDEPRQQEKPKDEGRREGSTRERQRNRD